MADLGASPFAISATASYTIPQGVTSLQVDATGAGGAGRVGVSYRAGSGGGGGAFSRRLAIRVIPGKAYTFTVGTGATTSAGGASSFTGEDSVAVVAAGGSYATGNTVQGAGGTTATSTGDIKYAGGYGSAGTSGAIIGGSGGGEGAELTKNGVNGGPGSVSAVGTGGYGGAGGDGGNGGTASSSAAGAGVAGSAPGGGGGGGGCSTKPQYGAGARGGDGNIVVTYVTNVTRQPGIFQTLGY